MKKRLEWFKTPFNEQETIIQISREGSTASVYTTDTTMVTKLDKKYPRKKEILCDGKLAAIEYFVPKRDVRFTLPRTLTEEQRKACAERISKGREKIRYK